MEQLEIKKSIERKKAIVTIAMILLILSGPSFMLSAPDQIAALALLAPGSVVFLMYRRIRRLNFKLARLAK